MASKLARHPNKTQLCEELRKIKAIREVKQLVNKQTNKDIQWWKDRYVTHKATASKVYCSLSQSSSMYSV